MEKESMFIVGLTTFKTCVIIKIKCYILYVISLDLSFCLQKYSCWKTILLPRSTFKGVEFLFIRMRLSHSHKSMVSLPWFHYAGWWLSRCSRRLKKFGRCKQKDHLLIFSVRPLTLAWKNERKISTQPNHHIWYLFFVFGSGSHW